MQVAAKLDLKNVEPWQTPFTVIVGRDLEASLEAIWSKNRPW